MTPRCTNPDCPWCELDRLIAANRERAIADARVRDAERRAARDASKVGAP